ncbi:Hypothetical predicted protein [Paramuricea clavata]|uniref:Uncharacterized protein n=1 Tax=Paramuricea clavata TaxID=317549 RepID=A0A6S7H6Z6_PARCT|nr:Hypothetical predicted protein [Paramuricea clavata]
MNLLDAIGTLMDGRGIKEILGTIYGENAVQHVMTGKAVQRALRGHLLDQCLTQQVVDKVTCLGKIAQILSSKEGKLSAHSATAKLWLVYQQMIRTARELIKADRTGSWLMHLVYTLYKVAAAGHSNDPKSAYLYLQSMTRLEKDNLSVFRKFMNGLHVIRRSDQYWAGLGCNLVIEQALIRSLKIAGGLTRGSGMSEHQRVL